MALNSSYPEGNGSLTFVAIAISQPPGGARFFSVISGKSRREVGEMTENGDCLISDYATIEAIAFH